VKTIAIVGSSAALGMSLARRSCGEGFQVGLIARRREQLAAFVEESGVRASSTDRRSGSNGVAMENSLHVPDTPSSSRSSVIECDPRSRHEHRQRSGNQSFLRLRERAVQALAPRAASTASWFV
jgi:NAD(P)-dependent dehydrogenase (short-subunit alcohol dehydrogenase family)